MSVPPLSGTELAPIRREALAFELLNAADHLRSGTNGRYERAQDILRTIANRELALTSREPVPAP